MRPCLKWYIWKRYRGYIQCDIVIWQSNEITCINKQNNTMKQKNGIICLETEWEHTVEKNRRSIHTKPLLEFLEKSSGCDIIYRRVATKNELQYYLRRFNLAKYDNYSIIYLSFHGDTIQSFWKEKKGMRQYWAYLTWRTCLTAFLKTGLYISAAAAPCWEVKKS